ncbi:hypothetical protein HF086_006274 [Spodoptera exigua]|uniref:Secreted protein n=1 Tax=Spodoptera exigua TaxID=7107 RepID=A0A922M2Y4_SPOEX|nr:hypothetical protein HF086_006274 [Spodoptera exigua]
MKRHLSTSMVSSMVFKIQMCYLLVTASVWQIHSCREYSARKPDRCRDGWDLLGGGVLLGPVHHSYGDLCITHASEITRT